MNTTETFQARLAPDRLILANEEFSESMLALYAELDEAEPLREDFVNDPARVIRERIFVGGGMSIAAGDNRANRFFFALLGSSRFQRWIAEYQDNILRHLRYARAQSTPKEGMRLAVKLLDRRKWLQDLTEGLKEYGEERLHRALLPPAVAFEDCPVQPERSLAPIRISHDLLAQQVNVWLDNVFGIPSNSAEENAKPALASRLTDEQIFALYDFFYRFAPQPTVVAGADGAAQEDREAGGLGSLAPPARILFRQFATIIAQQILVCIERLRMSRELREQYPVAEKPLMSGGGR